MKVAIAGFGIEGKANYTYWRGHGHDVTIVDEQPIGAHDLPYGASSMTGPGVLGQLNGYDMVVRTASMNPAKIKTDGLIWSATNEFFDKCPAPIIGVTGTKGKGTTCSLITSILRAAGKTVHLVGNIGVAALDVLPSIKPNDVVVYEMSSFQLWDLKKSPHIAVVVMIEPDHLDVHKDFDDYANAKANIVRTQTSDDICIYHSHNKNSAYIASQAPGSQLIRYGTADDGGVYDRDGYFWQNNERICSIDALQIPGAHNVENACAAITAALAFGVEPHAVEQGLKDFEGLPHRIKFVREFDGVKYYDDSIATTPGSAIAAMRAFSQPKVIILGGSSKGQMYDDVITECSATNTHVVAIGETGGTIVELCKQHNVDVTDMGTSNMSQIVGAASHVARPGGVVLLSPASASFGMFTNYADRGDQFVAAVESLSK